MIFSKQNAHRAATLLLMLTTAFSLIAGYAPYAFAGEENAGVPAQETTASAQSLAGKPPIVYKSDALKIVGDAAGQIAWTKERDENVYYSNSYTSQETVAYVRTADFAEGASVTILWSDKTLGNPFDDLDGLGKKILENAAEKIDFTVGEKNNSLRFIGL